MLNYKFSGIIFLEIQNVMEIIHICISFDNKQLILVQLEGKVQD